MTNEEVALQYWVRTVTGLTTIHERLDGPKPPRPYASVYVLSDSEESRPIRALTTNVVSAGIYEVTSRQSYEGTVSIKIFAPDASTRMKKVKAAAQDPELRALLHEYGVVMRGNIPMSLGREFLDTTWKDQAIADFKFAYWFKDTLSGRGVESIEATQEVNNNITNIVEVP